MVLKNGIFVLALWTLLLVPTLCGVGVLVHACLGGGADDCHAEVPCSTDPCQILVIPTAAAAGKTNDGGVDASEVDLPAFADAQPADMLLPNSLLITVSVVNLSLTPASGQTLPLLC